MACVVAQTNRGTTNPTNQDACCALVASTPLGEVAMGVVCDGVGGLTLGELASATVVNHFVHWFENELPTLMAGMIASGAFDFDLVETVWRAQLDGLNSLIQAHGAQVGNLGTTFTGVIVSGNRFLAGHIGDCRLYRIGENTILQLSEDQTLVAHRLALGEITLEEAKVSPERHVIMQAVGTERMLRPAFYRGEIVDSDLLVICCDGAYQQATDGELVRIFSESDSSSVSSLEDACRRLIDFDIAHGETDNLTVVCIAMGGTDTIERRDAVSAPRENVDAVPTQVSDIALHAIDVDAIPTTVVSPDTTPTVLADSTISTKDHGAHSRPGARRGDA